MHTNPFEVYKHELSVDRHTGNRFLGKSMFWRNFESTPKKHVYRSTSVEYRSIKLMLVETVLIVLATVLFSFCTTQQYDSISNLSAIAQARFWESSVGSVTNISTFWSWMSTDLPSLVFSSQGSVPDVSAQLIPPTGWLSMTADESVGYVSVNGLFSIQSEPDWRALTVGGSPFDGNVILGPLRVRQVALTDAGEELTTKEKLIGTPSEIVSAFEWNSANMTQQAVVSTASGFKIPASGYVFDFPLSLTEARSQTDLLKEWSWIDESTEAVVVELGVLNSRSGYVSSSLMVFSFDNSTVTPTYIQIPLSAGSLNFGAKEGWMLVTFGIFCAFTFFQVFIVFFAGPVDYFTYCWNLIDVVIVVLFFVLAHRIVSDLPNMPSALLPVFGPVHAWFKPFSVFMDSYASARRIAAALLVLTWLRLMKPLMLFAFARPTIKIIQGTVFRLCFVILPFLAIFGILVAAFSGALHTPLFSSSNTFYSLWGLYANGVDVMSNFWENRDSAVPLYIFFLAVMYFFLPCVCIDVAFRAHAAYSREAVAARQYATSDRLGAEPTGIDPDSFWHSSVMTVFFYTWFHRLRGVDLIPEKDEDIGFPEEQWIDLDMLPETIQSRWVEKRAELIELTEVKRKKPKLIASMNESMFGKRMSRLYSAASKTASRVFGGQLKSARTSVAARRLSGISKNDRVISRVQLQRLLDYDDELVEILRDAEGFESPLSSRPSSPVPPSESGSGSSRTSVVRTIRAIDVIRRYKTAEAMNKKILLESLLGSSKLQTDHSHRAVKKGLSEVVTELETTWKSQLVLFSESVAAITADLAKIQSSLDIHR